MDQIEGVCRRIFPKYFGGSFTSFQILYKSRYNGNIDRTAVIKLLADLVCEINPLNVVDLTNPKYSVIVEVVKNIVCIGVVTDFTKFKKYNLHEAAGEVPVIEKSEKPPTDGSEGVDADGKPKLEPDSGETTNADAKAETKLSEVNGGSSSNKAEVGIVGLNEI